MNIYKQNYKAKDGTKAKTSKFYIEFFDHSKIRRKIAAFADRRNSESFGRNIESLVNCRMSGLEHDVKLNQWLETLPTDILNKFSSWGLIDGQRAEITKPLSEHIKEYAKILKAKDFSADYCKRMENRLTKIIKDCRFNFFRDITLSAIELYIDKLRKEEKNNTTIGHYIDALKTFLNWAKQDQRIRLNPIADMQKPQRDLNAKRKGILTPEQFIILIKETFTKNTIIDDTSGQDRAVLYVLAGTTGLRRNELLNLTWNDINLNDENPFVKVRAIIAKNGKEAFQPIPLIAIDLLTALKANTKPKNTDRVFSGFDMSINTAGLIQADLKAAGIEKLDKDGNEIVFHSLRNSYISWLANSQTPAKVVQKLARHSDPKLTFNVYARVLPEAEQKAISFLPDFGKILSKNRLCVSLWGNGQNQSLPVANSSNKNSENKIKTAFPLNAAIPSRGVEPLLQA